MKRVIVIAGAKMHRDLQALLKARGYKISKILTPPPENLHGPQKVMAASRALLDIAPPVTANNNGNVTVLFAEGDTAWWVAATTAYKAITDHEPLILTPIHGGYRGQHDCMKGNQRGLTLP